MIGNKLEVREPREDIPQLNKFIIIGEDKERGRYLEATNYIPFGVVVCNETGIVVAEDKEKCDFCLKPNDRPSKTFCSECKKTYQSKYATYEGNAKQAFSNRGLVRLCIRVIATYSPEILKTHFIDNEHPIDCPFSKIFALKGKPGIDFREIDHIIEQFEKRFRSTKEWKSAPKQLFKLAFKEIFARLDLNGHVVYPLERIEGFRKPEDIVPFGAGLFPIGSIANHSCSANVYSFFHHNQFIMVSLGIGKGEEVLDSYGIQAHSSPRAERQAFLQGRGFICSCSTCKENRLELELLPPIDKETGEERKLPSSMTYEEIQEFISNRILSFSHVALMPYLEQNIRNGIDDEKCFEMLVQNQLCRDICFSYKAIEMHLIIIDRYRDSEKHQLRLLDWVGSVIFLMSFCKVHPRLDEMEDLWFERFEKKKE